MTREETKKAIEVMQAYVDGVKIQVSYRKKETWDCLTSEPLWDWFNLKYRIKPEPMDIEVFINEMGDKDINPPAASFKYHTWTKKKFREVIE